MWNMSFIRIGGAFVILGAISFIAGSIIHDTGNLPGYRWVPDDPGQWLLDVDRQSTAVATETWLKILGLLLATGFLAIFHALRRAGPLLWIAAVAFIASSLLITAQLLVVLGLIYELAPAYAEASEATRPALEVTATTLLKTGILAEFVADHLFQPIGTALVGLAILRTSVVPRWMGWMALVLAFMRSMGLLEPASDVFRVFSPIGFTLSGVWILAMGVIMLRLREPAETTSPA